MDYSQLPEDIIVKIARDHLETLSQLLAFSHICKSWRSTAFDNGPHQRPCLPGLLVTERDSDDHHFVPLTMFDTFVNTPLQDRFKSTITNTAAFQAAVSRKLPRVTIPLGSDIIHTDNPREKKRRKNPCVASKDGWVLLIQSGPVKLYLLNPITRSTLVLPLFRPNLLASINHKFYINPAEYVIKAVISSSPDGEDCYVFVILHSHSLRHRLAWCKVGSGPREEQGWKFIDLPNLFYANDATYLGGKLYILGHKKVYVLDHVPTTTLRAVSFSPAMVSITDGHRSLSTFYHLSHLNGHLLVTFGTLDHDIAFQVFKLVSQQGDDVENNISSSDDCWEEVKSLDGHALFLGYSHPSICLPVAPFSHEVEGDRIYFAFSFNHGYFDLDFLDDMGCNWNRNSCGVFNLANLKLESLAHRSGHNQNYFWFLPTPWNTCEHKKHNVMSAHNWERLLSQTTRNNSNDNTRSNGAAVRMERTTPKKKKTNKNQPAQCKDNVVPSIRYNRFEPLLLAEDEAQD